MSIPAVILAAGRATRLRPLTDHLPKCLLEVAGVAMLERSLRHLIDAGVSEVVIVTGFQCDKLRTALSRWRVAIDVELVHNPEYDRTNNAYSLSLVEHALARRPFLLLDSDLVYDAPIPRALLERGGSCLALRRAADLTGEEVKVELVGGDRIAVIGKDVPLDCAEGESVGLEVFDADGAAHLFATLRARMGRGLIGEYYEASFQQMIDEGARIAAVDIAPHRAMEIDTPADLVAAQHAFGVPWPTFAPPRHAIAT